jgi:hypothetical protein
MIMEILSFVLGGAVTVLLLVLLALAGIAIAARSGR